MTKETAQKIYNAINNNTVVLVYITFMTIMTMFAIHSLFAGYNDIFYAYVVAPFYALSFAALAITEYTMMIINFLKLQSPITYFIKKLIIFFKIFEE